MEANDMNSYDFYVKNFPFIKYSIEDKYKNQTDNIMLVIFYDNDLYCKYKEIHEEDDFILLLKYKFIDFDDYNNEELGVLIMCGDLVQTVDLVINDVFSEKKGLTEKELESIGIINGNKSRQSFYINLVQINFFDSKGAMSFKFKDIKNGFSNCNENENIINLEK